MGKSMSVKNILKITLPQSPPALSEETFESGNSQVSAGATKIGSLFSAPATPVKTLPMKASPRATTLQISAKQQAKLSIKVSVPRSRSASANVSPVAGQASPQMRKWQDAQSVDWKPVQTRRGSATRALSTPRTPSRKMSCSPSPRTLSSPSPRTVTVGDGDILSKYARGTNGPARPEGSDPRRGRGATLGRTSPTEGNDLGVNFGRNSRKPSTVTNNRFGFVSHRNSAQPRPSVTNNRTNPQYEKSAARERGMSKNTWRTS